MASRALKLFAVLAVSLLMFQPFSFAQKSTGDISGTVTDQSDAVIPGCEAVGPLKFVTTPRPAPESFGTLAFYGVNAFKFTNAAGASRFGRYRILPVAGNEYLDDTAAAAQPPNFLFDDLADRIRKGPIRFKIVVQIANPEDVIDNNQVHWPEDRQLVELGTLELTKIAPDSQAQQKQIIFDPIPRLDGIAPSADPLLELRAAIYLLSGRRRRSAPETQSSAA